MFHFFLLERHFGKSNNIFEKKKKKKKNETENEFYTDLDYIKFPETNSIATTIFTHDNTESSSVSLAKMLV